MKTKFEDKKILSETFVKDTAIKKIDFFLKDTARKSRFDSNLKQLKKINIGGNFIDITCLHISNDLNEISHNLIKHTDIDIYKNIVANIAKHMSKQDIRSEIINYYKNIDAKDYIDDNEFIDDFKLNFIRQLTSIEYEHFKNNFHVKLQKNFSDELKIFFEDDIETNEINIDIYSLVNFIKYYINKVNFMFKSSNVPDDDKIDNYCENLAQLLKLEIETKFNSINDLAVDNLDTFINDINMFTDKNGKVIFGKDQDLTYKNIKKASEIQFKILIEQNNKLLSELKLSDLRKVPNNLDYNNLNFSILPKTDENLNTSINGPFFNSRFFIKFLYYGKLPTAASKFDTSKYRDIEDNCIVKQITNRILEKNLYYISKYKDHMDSEKLKIKLEAEKIANERAEEKLKQQNEHDIQLLKQKNELLKDYKDRDFIKVFITEPAGYKIKIDFNLLKDLNERYVIEILPKKINKISVKNTMSKNIIFMNDIKNYINNDIVGFKKHIISIVNNVVLDIIKNKIKVNVGGINDIQEIIVEEKINEAFWNSSNKKNIKNLISIYVNDNSKIDSNDIESLLSNIHLRKNKEWLVRVIKELLISISILLVENISMHIDDYMKNDQN